MFLCLDGLSIGYARILLSVSYICEFMSERMVCLSMPSCDLLHIDLPVLLVVVSLVEFKAVS